MNMIEVLEDAVDARLQSGNLYRPDEIPWTPWHRMLVVKKTMTESVLANRRAIAIRDGELETSEYKEQRRRALHYRGVVEEAIALALVERAVADQ